MENANINVHVEGNLSVGQSTGSVNADPDAVKQMEMQLHEQYAQNYNDTFGAVATLFAAMIAVLYGYGYVFLNSSLSFSRCLDELCCDGVYTADALIIVSIATLIVLTIMQYTCLHFGASQRMEQFIIYAIRRKYYGMEPVEMNNPRIYPQKYRPDRKGRCNFVVGIYGPFICALHVLNGIVFFATFIKVCLLSNDCSCTKCIMTMLLFITYVSCLAIFHCAKESKFKVYREREEEYTSKKQEA